jgi:hypothetical protein
MLRRILLGCGVITTSDLDKVTLATATIRNIDSRTEQEHKIPQNEDVFHSSSAGETHVHFHIDAIDGASVHSFLNSHGDSIAETVHRSLKDRLSRAAVV